MTAEELATVLHEELFRDGWSTLDIRLLAIVHSGCWPGDCAAPRAIELRVALARAAKRLTPRGEYEED